MSSEVEVWSQQPLSGTRCEWTIGMYSEYKTSHEEKRTEGLLADEDSHHQRQASGRSINLSKYHECLIAWGNQTQ